MEETSSQLLYGKYQTILSNELEEQGADVAKLWERSEEGIAEMIKAHPVLLGQKIPASVQPFSRQEIKEGQFRAKHSSVLRIMTKWAEYLEGIFEKPEKTVLKKIYAFKNVHN